MGLTAASVARFRAAIDSTLAELFPVLLVINGAEVAASGPGGRTLTDFMDGGKNDNFRFPFRIGKTATPAGWSPVIGGSLHWKVSDSQTIPLEIIQTHLHPHEAVWEITARKLRV